MTNELLARIDLLEQENKELKQQCEIYSKRIYYLEQTINNIHTYIEKMSYCEVVDNPKKELSRILEKGK